MTIHSLIREGRRRLGMSEQQFAEAVGVSRGAVQQWEKPGGTAPKRANQPRVAGLLGVSLAELVSGGLQNVSGSGFDMRAEVPLVSEVEAGNFTAIDNFKPDGKFVRVPVTVPVKRHTYAFRVDGDSMVSPIGDSFPEGSILIVEPEMQAVSGDYVIALRGGTQATFKQLVADGGDLYLKPLNPRYPIRSLDGAVVVGVVREFTKRFR